MYVRRAFRHAHRSVGRIGPAPAVKRRPRRQEIWREKLGSSASALLPLPADAVPLRPVGRSWGKVWQSISVDPATFSRRQGLRAVGGVTILNARFLAAS